MLCIIQGGQSDIECVSRCRVLDIEGLPGAYNNKPVLGMEAMKKRCGAENRPLFGSIIKPKSGLTEDQLIINVTYGGGCENHDFKMILHYESPIDGGGQQIQILSLSHDANNDGCEALILEHELCFNISNIENDGVLYFSHADSLFVLN